MQQMSDKSALDALQVDAKAPAPPPLEDDEEDDQQDEQDADYDVVVDEEVTNRALEAVNELKDKSSAENGEVTLLDEMMAASSAARKVQEERKTAAQEEMNKTFADGLKSAMKQGLEKQKEKKVIVNALKQQGNDAFKKQDWEEARKLYSKALAQCSGGSESWYDGECALYSNRSLVLLRLNQPEAALQDAKAALKLNKKWAKGYSRKANALKALNRDGEAVKSFEKGIELLKGTKDAKVLEAEYKAVYPKEHELYRMPVLGGGNNENKNQRNNPLEIPEVKEQFMQTLADGQWANDAFAKAIAENPILSKGLTDPRGAMLLKRLQQDPQAALQEYKDVPEARMFIQEFMKVVGSHFIKLGEADEKRQAAAAQPPQIMTEEESKLQKEANKVLENEELRTILADPETHQVLQRCGDPTVLAKYMQDPKWSNRIRMLRDNGLVRFEQ